MLSSCSLAQALLAARAEVNAKSNDNESALYLAQKSEYEDVVKVLIEAGATGGDDKLPKLVLVKAEDPRRCVFEHDAHLKQSAHLH